MAKSGHVARMDSCDTLADVDMNFVEMRTCDGACGDILCVEQLWAFECRHAVCEACLAQLSQVQGPASRELCPLRRCGQTRLYRKAEAMREYEYVKSQLLSRFGPSRTRPRTSDSRSQSEVPLSLPALSSPSASASTDSWHDFSGSVVSGFSVDAGLELVQWESSVRVERSSTDRFSLSAPASWSASTAVKPEGDDYPVNATDIEPDLLRQLLRLTACTARPEEPLDAGCSTASSFSLP